MVRQTLKSRRLALKFTQSYVAQRCGIDVTTYCKIERGHSNPNVILAQRIATTLQASMDSLFFDASVTPVDVIDPTDRATPLPAANA